MNPLPPLRRAVARGGFLVPFTIVWALGVLLPVLGIVLFSFFDSRGVKFIFELSLEAYESTFSHAGWQVLLRSARITATVTVIELIVAYPFALWLAKSARSPLLKLATFAALTVPFFLSPASRTIVWRVILGKNGLINTILLEMGIVDEPLDWLLFSEPAVHFGFFGPYFPNMVWPLFLSITLIDDEIIEASHDLGGGRFHTFWHVILPLSLPGIVAGVGFTFVPMMGDTVVPQTVGGGAVLMLSSEINSLFSVLNYPVAAAVSALALLLVALFSADHGPCAAANGRHCPRVRGPATMTLMSAPTTGRGRRGITFVDRLMRTARPFGVAVGYVWVTLIYIPIVWLAVMSVSSRPLTGVPYPLSLEWYDALFSGDMRWLPPLERSLVLGLIVSVLCMISATMVGRVLPQLRRRGGLLAAYLAPLFVPALVTGVSMFMFYRALIGLKLGGLVAGPGPFRLGISVRPAGDARGLVAFRHPHERGGIRSGRDQLAALLADRGAAAQARDHRLGLLRLSPVLQRAAAQHLHAGGPNDAPPPPVGGKYGTSELDTPDLRHEHAGNLREHHHRGGSAAAPVLPQGSTMSRALHR